MHKVVSTGLKIDLHIHSAMSSSKDGVKVRNNTLTNIPVLIEKLNDQGVNICAITDHDTFSYEMYSALKQAETTENSIQKVLPGIEFSVCFFCNGKESVIHIVTIFSDEDDEKVKEIEKIVRDTPPDYHLAYREEDFLALLRKIDINTILIAHQKNTLSSKKARKNDANTLGDAKFLEFVYTDYFEAFEFRNKRNEVLNKTYLVQNDLEEQVRFVTGTDCHDWSVYPSEEPSESIESFPYTYVKCLPTFKGLVMAITDHSRMKMVNSFFTVAQHTLSEIKMVHATKEITIPLSKGLNVIIGDNSVGKSMLLHALTGYTKPAKLLPNATKVGYKKYLKELGLEVRRQIADEHIFCFDMQGEVRTKFEENQLNRTEFLGPYFPSPVDNLPYRTLLEAELARMIEYLRRKFEYDSKIKSLATFSIEVSEENAESLTFVNNIGHGKQKSAPYSGLAVQFENLLTQINSINPDNLDEEDAAEIEAISKSILRMKKKYEEKASLIEAENDRMESISSVIRKKSNAHKKNIGDTQKKRSLFAENASELKNQIIDLISARRGIETYMPDLAQTKIRAKSNRVFDYEFIAKLKIEEISTEYFLSLISRVLKNGKSIVWESITEKQLKEMLLKYDETPVLEFLSNAIKAEIEEDLQHKNSIIYQGMDKYAEMSSGLDAKIYFDLLSYEMQRDGIYIIDQPEDNISQSAIREYLLDRFKTMGENRQVIMVSHNPQFIVNLDVDNLIFLSKENGELKVQSGALEYSCPEYTVLDIVAKNIDGGLDSIRKRWKRYEKTADI